MRILITGSHGLIGSSLCTYLQNNAVHIDKIDVRSDKAQERKLFDDPIVLHNILGQIDGVIHLAGYSRIPAAVKDPTTCWRINAVGTQSLVNMMTQQQNPPWLIYASSREVYGDQQDLPVSEKATFSPNNIYAESKVYAEKIINDAVKLGLRAEIIRFSNVYGSIHDYQDRVVPAFCYAALSNQPLQVMGANNTFDFTFVDDIVKGIYKLAIRLQDHKMLRGPFHFTTGIGTSLQELAQQIIKLTASTSQIIDHPARSFGASKFIGNPDKTQQLLDWSPSIKIKSGLEQFITRIQHEKNQGVQLNQLKSA